VYEGGEPRDSFGIIDASGEVGFPQETSDLEVSCSLGDNQGNQSLCYGFTMAVFSHVSFIAERLISVLV
jgi:hypothetical protein